MNKRMTAGTEFTLHWKQIRPEHGRILGQKCARLAQMKQMGFPVPPFFALTTEAVSQILARGQVPPRLKTKIMDGIWGVEDEAPEKPLLLAVRSGDPVHLAGALTTFINVGLCDKTLHRMAVEHQNEPVVLRMYLDLMVDFALKVGRVGRSRMLPVMQRMRENPKDPDTLKALIEQALNLFPDFPQDPENQVFSAIGAIAASWESAELRPYKESLRLGEGLLPSIIIQKMVYSGFANSAFAAFCTRNPVTGEDRLTGEFSLGVEGRWVMRGHSVERKNIDRIDEYFPGTRQFLAEKGGIIEAHAKHPQDLEVVIEAGQVQIIQAVNAILSNLAQERVTREFRDSWILIGSESLPRDESRRVIAVKTYKLNPEAEFKEVARGNPASPGAVWGRLALSVEAASQNYTSNEPTILLASKPDDRVLHLLLQRRIAGLAATYGSTHDEAVARLSLTPAVMSVVLPDGQKIYEGEKIVLDGEGGRLLRTEHGQPVLEDRIVGAVPYDIDLFWLEKNTRERFRRYSYEELLREHAQLVEALRIKSLAGGQQTEEQLRQIAELELVTHFVHFMIGEEGVRLGKLENQIRLEVARADGNLDRVPGFEGEGFLLKRTSRTELIPLPPHIEMANRVLGIPTPIQTRVVEELFIVAGVFYDDRGRPNREEEMRKKAERETQLRRVIEQGRTQGLEIFLQEDSRLIDYAQGRVHGGSLIYLGLRFPEEDLEQVLELLRNNLDKSAQE